jgi:hypothetical protein
MLRDWHAFSYYASVPWPDLENTNWMAGVKTIEFWLNDNVGPRWSTWAWSNSDNWSKIAVSFRWDQDRSLFILRWA